MKRGWVLGLLALLVLPCSAQQIMYSNLKELVEGRGDTVTILKVEKRSKNQIYLMGGADYRIEAKDNSGLCRYLKSRCYAVRMDTSLYVNCKKMRYKRFRYYSPEMGIYISSDPIGLAGGFNTYAYVKDTNTWVDVLGLSGELVYQLIRDNKVVYYGITSRTALERMAEHGKTKVFDNMEILADGLTHDQARSIEGALIRQRLKERADDWSDFDSIKARLDKSGLDNRNRGRIKERWTSENPLDDLRDKIYKKPKKVKVGCKS